MQNFLFWLGWAGWVIVVIQNRQQIIDWGRALVAYVKR